MRPPCAWGWEGAPAPPRPRRAPCSPERRPTPYAAPSPTPATAGCTPARTAAPSAASRSARATSLASPAIPGTRATVAPGTRASPLPFGELEGSGTPAPLDRDHCGGIPLVGGVSESGMTQAERSNSMNSSAFSWGERGPSSHPAGGVIESSVIGLPPTCRSLYTTRPQYVGPVSFVVEVVGLIGVSNEKYIVQSSVADSA